MFNITPVTQTFNNNFNHSNLQQPQDPPTKIAPKWGVPQESMVFDCLDPDPWCFPNVGKHHRPNPTTPSSIHSSRHQSTSESTLCIIFPVFPSFFADKVSSLYPSELGPTSLLRTGGFTVNTASCCKASKACSDINND